MTNPFPELITHFENAQTLDLDGLRAALETARGRWDERENLLTLYHDELARELRAKVKLCGGTPALANPDELSSLAGPALLAARREASLRFNQIFQIAPISRDKKKL